MEDKKTHDIKVKLSDEDYIMLKNYANDYKTSINKLIEAFIYDLVDSKESGGSDERRLANEWYERNKYNF